MNDKFIEIVVKPDGNTTVTTKGFTGPSCRDASRFIGKALGKPVNEQLTAEFHQTSVVRQKQQQQT